MMNRKVLLIISCSILLSLVIFVGLIFFIDKKISTDKGILIKEISERYNLDIDCSAINLYWDITGPYVKLTNLTISTKSNKSILAIANLNVNINWLPLIIHNNLTIKKLNMEGLIAKVSYEHDKLALIDKEGKLLQLPITFKKTMSLPTFLPKEISIANSKISLLNNDIELPIVISRANLLDIQAKPKLKLSAVLIDDINEQLNSDVNISYNNHFFNIGISNWQLGKLKELIPSLTKEISFLQGGLDLNIQGQLDNSDLVFNKFNYNINNLILKTVFSKESFQVRNFNGFLQGYGNWQTKYFDLAGKHSFSDNNDRNISIAYKSKKDSAEEIIEITTDCLKLKNWYTLIKNIFKLNTEIVAIDADIKKLQLEYNIKHPIKSKLQATIHNLFLYNADFIVHGLNGDIKSNNGTGNISFDTTNATLIIPKIFTRPFENFSLQGNVNWEQQAGNTKFIFQDILYKDSYINLQSKGNIINNEVDIVANLDSLSIKNLDYYLPKKILKADLQNWLAQAFHSGTINSGSFKLQGNLKNFPFKDASGIYNWELDVNNVDLSFSPQWPLIENIKAKIVVDKDTLAVHSNLGTILGSTLQKTEVIITNLTADKPTWIKVKGDVNGTLATGLDFLLASPLDNSLANRLKTLSPTGDLQLNLNLMLPLGNDSNPMTMKGRILLNNNSLKLEHSGIKLTQISGPLIFTESEIKSEGLSCNINNTPVNLNIKTIVDKEGKWIRSNVAGETSFNSLSNKYLPDNITKALKGKFKYNAFLDIGWDENKHSRLEIISNFKGVSLNLPKPLNKYKDDIWPTKINIWLKDNKPNRLAIKIANLGEAKIFLKSDNEQINIKNGFIAFNQEADWPKEDILLVTGEIATLDWSNWLKYLPEKNNKKLSYRVELFIQQLPISSFILEDLWFRYPYNNQPNAFHTRSPNLLGSVSLPTKINPEININLEYLKWNNDYLPSNTNIANNLQDKLKNIKYFYPINFNCNVLSLDNSTIENIKLALIPKKSGYTIKDFEITNPSFNFKSSGNWDFIGGNSTSLQGNISIKSITKFMEITNYKESISGNKGDIDFKLEWPGSIFNFNLPNIIGNINIKAKKGVILGIDPGFGRVIGLLNVDNIKRRLQLDFSDLYKKGLSFDELTGTLYFKDGLATTNNFLIKGPSAKIRIDGNTFLAKQTINLNMKIIPKVSGNLPVAAAIAAGNPVVGAVVWMFNRAVRNKVNEANERYYKITGTWQTPKIKDLPKNQAILN